MSKHKQPGGIWTAQYAHCALANNMIRCIGLVGKWSCMMMMQLQLQLVPHISRFHSNSFSSSFFGSTLANNIGWEVKLHDDAPPPPAGACLDLSNSAKWRPPGKLAQMLFRSYFSYPTLAILLLLVFFLLFFILLVHRYLCDRLWLSVKLAKKGFESSYRHMLQKVMTTKISRRLFALLPHTNFLMCII